MKRRAVAAKTFAAQLALVHVVRRGVDADQDLARRRWASSSTGSRRYRRRSQNCLSFQASSQMVSAIGVPSEGADGLAFGRHEVAGFIEDVVGGQQHLRLPEDDLTRARSRRRCWWRAFPCQPGSGRRNRTTSAMPSEAVSAREALRGTRGAVEKAVLFDQIPRRVAGEGKLGKNDKFGAARRGLAGVTERCGGTFPSRSPTVVLICARAIRIVNFYCTERRQKDSGY